MAASPEAPADGTAEDEGADAAPLYFPVNLEGGEPTDGLGASRDPHGGAGAPAEGQRAPAGHHAPPEPMAA